MKKIRSQDIADFIHLIHFFDSSTSRHHLFSLTQFLQERIVKISTFKVENRFLRRSMNENAFERDI